jgi:hypothetical protein
MELILDKGFLDGFFRYNFSDETKTVYDSFIRFVKGIKLGDVKVICDFSNYEELEDYIAENPLMYALDDRQPDYVLKPNLSQDIKNASFYISGSLFKMFFIELVVEKCEILEGQVGYSFIDAQSMGKKWNNFLTSKELVRYHVSTNTDIAAEERFDSWSKFDDFKHPINALVIADKYILCDTSEKKIDHNLKLLLSQLIPDRETMFPIDITIIASQKNSNRSFKSIKTDLESYFRNCIAKVDINLTIIDYDDKVDAFLKGKYGSDLHDRRIVTTYYWYEVGKGFNLFKRDNKLNTIKLNPSNSRLYMGFNLFGSNKDDVSLLLEEYAACASVAETVYGSNNNRLLIPYQV